MSFFNPPIIPLKQPVVFPKTTRRFPKNNVSFSSKQRIVFLKTTYRFCLKS